MTKTPASVMSKNTRSLFLMRSFRMKKASTTTMRGDKLFTIAMIVIGRYLVTEKFIMFVIDP